MLPSKCSLLLLNKKLKKKKNIEYYDLFKLFKPLPEITVEIEPQPAALDFKNLFQYSSRSK